MAETKDKFVVKFCGADCDKINCARNKKNRVIFAKGEDLKNIQGGRCGWYLPIFKLTIEDKRGFKIKV